MIEIIPLDGSQTIQFENYNELFDYIVAVENNTLLENQSDNKQGDWCFNIYLPTQVSVLFTHAIEQDDAIREAYEEELSLIEVCAGSYKHPVYIVSSANTDIDFLKKKWCLDYCTYHDFILRDYSKIYKSGLYFFKESLCCMT